MRHALSQCVGNSDRCTFSATLVDFRRRRKRGVVTFEGFFEQVMKISCCAVRIEIID